MKIYTNPNSMPKSRTVFFKRDDRIHTGEVIGFTDDRDTSYAVVDKYDNELLSVPVADCDFDREQAEAGHYKSLIEEVRTLRIILGHTETQRDKAVMEAATLRGRCIAHGISIEMPEKGDAK